MGLLTEVVHREPDRVTVDDPVEVEVLVVEVDRIEGDLTVRRSLGGAAVAGDGERHLEAIATLAGLAPHEVVAGNEVDGQRARGARRDVLDLAERVAVRLQHVQLVDLAAVVGELETDLASVDHVLVDDAAVVGAGHFDRGVGRLGRAGREGDKRSDGEQGRAWGHDGTPGNRSNGRGSTTVGQRTGWPTPATATSVVSRVEFFVLRTGSRNSTIVGTR